MAGRRTGCRREKLAAGMGYPVQALLMDDWGDFAGGAGGEAD